LLLSTSPVVTGTSSPTRMCASSLSRVRIEGVDSTLERASLRTALMMMPNSRSLLCPPMPSRPPLRPSSDCAAASRIASAAPSSSSSPPRPRLASTPPASAAIPGPALPNWVMPAGTVPSLPASSSCAQLAGRVVGDLHHQRLDQHLLAAHVQLADDLLQRALGIRVGVDDERVGARVADDHRALAAGRGDHLHVAGRRGGAGGGL